MIPTPARGRVSRITQFGRVSISENAKMQGTDISSYSCILSRSTTYASAAQRLSILSFRLWRISYRTF